MTQKEAANVLRISVRSIQRLVKRGRLSVRYEPGKTRPVAVLDANEVETLRAEFCSRPVFLQGVKSTEQKQLFGFRMEPKDLVRLKDEASKYGIHVGAYVRLLLQLSLDGALQSKVGSLNTELNVLQQRVTLLERTLSRFKIDVMNDLRETTEVVLEFTGMEPSEATLWVAKNLGSTE